MDSDREFWSVHSDREFWSVVYVESIKRGISHEWAAKAANDAVAQRNQSVPAEFDSRRAR